MFNRLLTYLSIRILKHTAKSTTATPTMPPPTYPCFPPPGTLRKILIHTFDWPPSFWASMALDRRIRPAHVPQTTLGVSLAATHSLKTSWKLFDWRNRLIVVLSPPGKINPCKPDSCSGSLISITSKSTSLWNGELFKALSRAALCSKKAPWMARTPIRNSVRLSAILQIEQNPRGGPVASDCIIVTSKGREGKLGIHCYERLLQTSVDGVI